MTVLLFNERLFKDFLAPTETLLSHAHTPFLYATASPGVEQWHTGRFLRVKVTSYGHPQDLLNQPDFLDIFPSVTPRSIVGAGGIIFSCKISLLEKHSVAGQLSQFLPCLTIASQTICSLITLNTSHKAVASALNVLQWHDLSLFFRAYSRKAASGTNSYITVKNVQASGCCSTPYFVVARIQRVFNQEGLPF